MSSLSLSLVHREQSLDTQFPSHRFGNVELIMLNKIADKINNSEKGRKNSIFRIPKVIVEKIGEYLDFSKLSKAQFDERWKNLEDRFYKMYSYVEDRTGYTEIGIRLSKLPALCAFKKKYLEDTRDWRNARRINTKLTLEKYSQEIIGSRAVLDNLYPDTDDHLTALSILQSDIVLLRAEDSRELSRMGTEFQRRLNLKPDERPKESQFTVIILDMQKSREFLTSFRNKSSVSIRESMDRLAEQSPSVISQTLVYGPIRSVKKALSRFKPY